MWFYTFSILLCRPCIWLFSLWIMPVVELYHPRFQCCHAAVCSIIHIRNSVIRFLNAVRPYCLASVLLCFLWILLFLFRILLYVLLDRDSLVLAINYQTWWTGTLTWRKRGFRRPRWCLWNLSQEMYRKWKEYLTRPCTRSNLPLSNYPDRFCFAARQVSH